MSTTHTELELETIRICQELIRIPSVNFGDGVRGWHRTYYL